MVRISAIFIAVCMVLIAASFGIVLFLRFGLSGAEAALVALAMLTALAAYNAISARTRERAEVSDQITTLARGTGDLARQLAEFGRRLTNMEARAEAVLDKALETAQPLAAEIEELSTLVKQLADSVAAHDAALNGGRRHDHAVPVAEPRPVPAPAKRQVAAPETVAAAPPAAAAAPSITAVPQPESKVPAFKGLDKDGIIAVIRGAIEANRIDLFLQPIVTLPQRKVRYYESLSRLRTERGEVVAAADFLNYAEAGGLVAKLDNLTLLRCVQVVRRLSLKNRDVGLFCNLSVPALTDSGFPHLLEFLDANRAIAPSLMFEFTQSAIRTMGPIEHESLAALAQRGFRFSLDNLSDLRVEPRELSERGFRFIKVPATLLLNRVGAASIDIHPADFSSLLSRFNIDLIADRVESESLVVDLLDYEVRFGQGFLFSPPRPVRAEALQGLAGETSLTEQSTAEPAKADAGEQPRRGAGLAAAAGGGVSVRGGGFASLARSGGGHT